MQISALLLCLSIRPAPVSAREHHYRCQNANVSVVTTDSREAAHVCSALDGARTFLRHIGLELSKQITIRLVGKMPETSSARSIGLCNSSSGEIVLLDYASLISSRTARGPFGERMNRAIWKSFVIHETVHAMLIHKFSRGIHHDAASEYIAAIAQIESLPHHEKTSLLERYPDVTGFDRTEEITLTYYLIDPGKFAVNAYLHYQKRHNGKSFIEHLYLNGLSDN